MPRKINTKHILVCLLLCSLFLTNYLNVIGPNGLLHSGENSFAIFFASDRFAQSAQEGGSNFGLIDYLASINSSAEFFISSMKQLRWSGPKNLSGRLAAIFTTQMTCLMYYSRISERILTQLNSIMITVFIHKKDGMK